MYLRKLNKILLVLVGVLAGGYSFAQEGNVVPTNDYEALGAFNNENITTEIACPSVSGETPSTSVFNVNAYPDYMDNPADMGDPLDNTFEWVVYGGHISSYTVNDTEISNNVGNYMDGDYRYATLIVTGIANPGESPSEWLSTIEVEFGGEVPEETYVAVRHSSEYGCSTGEWSVYVMQGDNTPPEITGLRADIPHLAWELREDYSFTVPTITDDCSDFLMFTMSVNDGDPVVLYGDDGEGLIDLQGSEMLINLIGEAPGDVNDNGTGVDNQVVFTWSDGVNEESHTWNIHVDFRPDVALSTAANPLCIGDDNGEIILDFEIEVEQNVLKEYSTDNVIFTPFTGSLVSELVEGTYYFRVSTDVNGYTSTSDVEQVDLTDPPPITVTDPETAITNEDCIGHNNGAINIAVDYTEDGETNDFRTYSLDWYKNGTSISPAPADPENLTGLEAADYRLIITDAEGCSISEDYEVIVDNDEPPTFDAEAPAMTAYDPEDVTVDGYVSEFVDDGLCYFEVPDNRFNPSAIDDACGTNGLTLNHDYTGTATDPWNDATTLNGARFPVGKTTVTWTATDATGNTATRTYNVYVEDNIPPSLTVEPDTEYPFCEPGQTIPLPGVDDNCEIQTVTCNFTPDVAGWDEDKNWWPNIEAGETETSLINFDISEDYNVEWIVTDINGRVTNDSYTLDFSEPLIFTTDYDLTPVTCNGQTDGGIIIDFTGGNTTYNVTVGAVFDETGDQTHYEVEDLQPNDYTITITDGDGCILQDDIEITEPNPVDIELDNQTNNICFDAADGILDLIVTGGNGGYTYAWSGPVYNYGDGHPWHAEPAYNFTGKEYYLEDLPTGHYELTVTDSKGCTESATYDIDAEDNDPPTYDWIPTGYTSDYESHVVETDPGECTYTAKNTEFDPQNVTDDCKTRVWHVLSEGDYGVTNITSIYSLDGAVFPVGIYEVLWVISDLDGNSEMELVTYSVSDEQDPEITCPADVNMPADEDECTAVIPTQITDAIVSDNCGLPENSVTFERSDYYWAELDYPFDARPNTETITWTVTDAAGNTASCVQEVNVYDDQLPTVLVLGSELDPVPVYLLGSGEYILLPEDIDDGTYDNCSNLEALFVGNEDEPYVLSCSDIGTPIEVTLTARDNSGMEASANTWVQVFDNIPPSASTQPFTVELDQNGEGVLYPINIYGGGYSDNCTNPDDIPGFDIEDYLLLSLTNDSDPLHNPDEDTNELQLSCDELGQTTIYLVVLDEYDNRGYYPATVNVTDNGAPIIVVDWDESTEIYVRSQSPNTNDARVELDPANFGSAIDECGADFELTMDPPYVDCNDVKVDTDEPDYVTVELVATDIYGNEAREDVNIRVRDNTDPVIVAQTTDIVLPNSEDVVMEAKDFFADYHDNCGVTVLGVNVTPVGATSWDPHQGANPVVTVGTRTYWDQATFSCAYEGDVTVYLYAADASGNHTPPTSFTTNVDSDLEITSLELDRCEIPNDPQSEASLQGTFFSTIVGGTTINSTNGYNWFSANSNYQAFAPRNECEGINIGGWCLGYWKGHNSSDEVSPGYTTYNTVTNSVQIVNLIVTDDNGCTASEFMTIREEGAGQSSSVFRHEREACRGATETYIQDGTLGNSFEWDIIVGTGTVTGPDNESSYTVIWDDPNLEYAEVQVVIRDGDCDTEVIYEVTIHDNPTPSLAISPGDGTGYYCPLELVTYTLDQNYEAYDWEITSSHGGSVINGGDLYNYYGVEWDAHSNPTAEIGSVWVEVTDDNGCNAETSLDISILDDTPPTISLPDNPTVDNIAGNCEGSVILRLREGDNYSDDCGSGVKTVEYRTREYDDDAGAWTAWSIWIDGNNVSGNYPVGETQVQWNVTDYSGNSSTDPASEYNINTITVNDVDNPGFTTSPQIFTYDAGPNCNYTHDAATRDMSLTGIDNCEIERVWVTFEGDATEYNVIFDDPTPNDPTDGYTFQNTVTEVTWHIEDKAGNSSSHTYQVQLEDITAPQLVFEPHGLIDDGTYNYEGTFADGQRFYIFAENEDLEYMNLSIPAQITDNCSMGDVTVTLTHHDGTETGPITVEDSDDDDIFTFTSNFSLGQTTVRWDFNDDSGFHPKSVTHYIVFASQNGFQIDCPENLDISDHECNLQPADFDEDASIGDLPEWFSWLRTYNVLTFGVSQSDDLKDPNGTECDVTRERDITLTYNIQIQGDATTQLTADKSCTQEYNYYIDNTGPVVDESYVGDLEIECGAADFDTQISDWLSFYARIDETTSTDHISDNCHSSGFTITHDYGGTADLEGTTCGDGSITSVTFTVEDGCGQTSTYVANIIFEDTTDPYFTDSDGNSVNMTTVVPDATVNCHEIPDPAVIGTDIFAADDCIADPEITFSESDTRNEDGISGTCDDNTYVIERIWTVTDACGNSTSYTQTLNVVDNEAPQWVKDVETLAPDMTVNCNNIPAIPEFTYTENCDINPTYSFNETNSRVLDPALEEYYNYTITRTWSVQDNCNAANIHTQVITIEDATAPVIDVQAQDETVECDGSGNLTQLNAWLTSHGGAEASDPCVSSLHFDWTHNYASDGWTSECGNTKYQEVTFTVTDPSGNAETTSATFTIEDTQAPEWSGTLSYDPGPYNRIEDLPPAYTTVAEIEEAGVSVYDECSPGDAGLTVKHTQDETVGEGCSYTVERTYTITDDCGYSISTLEQHFNVLDGIDPEITKSLEEITECADNTTNQSTQVTGLALSATDVSDNCNTGAWFVDSDNINDYGSLRYRVYHTTNNTEHGIPWTKGNPDDLTFYEGSSEVYYRLTDENGNDIEKHVYTINIQHRPDISNITVDAANEGYTGASDQPLQYSTHEYDITMENTDNLSNGNAYWQIFDTGDRATPYTEGTDYTLSVSNSGNDATATVTFDGDLTVGNTYDLVFTENHAVSGCTTQRSYSFTLNGPFDVDITDTDDICPDADADVLVYETNVQPDGTGTTTTVTYFINLISTAYENNWSFDYAISIGEEGAGTNDASINSVTFSSDGSGMTAPSTASGTVAVNYNSGDPTTMITLEVEYNDIHGTTQLVEVALTNITGQNGEVDENTQLGTEDDETTGLDAIDDQNNVKHLIENIPLPGNIGGVD